MCARDAGPTLTAVGPKIVFSQSRLSLSMNATIVALHNVKRLQIGVERVASRWMLTIDIRTAIPLLERLIALHVLRSPLLVKLGTDYPFALWADVWRWQSDPCGSEIQRSRAPAALIIPCLRRACYGPVPV
jgi:hypothetical protein